MGLGPGESDAIPLRDGRPLESLPPDVLSMSLLLLAEYGAMTYSPSEESSMSSIHVLGIVCCELGSEKTKLNKCSSFSVGCLNISFTSGPLVAADPSAVVELEF